MNKLSLIWKTKDLRNKILIVLGLLLLTRVLAHIPIAGIDASAIPEIGPFIAAGPILVVLSNVETAAENSSSTGALVALGLPANGLPSVITPRTRSGIILASCRA